MRRPTTPSRTASPTIDGDTAAELIRINRLALLELMFNTSVTGNPFTVTFETLDGTVVEGVWNTTAKRIEF